MDVLQDAPSESPLSQIMERNLSFSSGRDHLSFGSNSSVVSSEKAFKSMDGDSLDLLSPTSQSSALKGDHQSADDAGELLAPSPQLVQLDGQHYKSPSPKAAYAVTKVDTFDKELDFEGSLPDKREDQPEVGGGQCCCPCSGGGIAGDLLGVCCCPFSPIQFLLCMCWKCTSKVTGRKVHEKKGTSASASPLSELEAPGKTSPFLFANSRHETDDKQAPFSTQHNYFFPSPEHHDSGVEK